MFDDATRGVDIDLRNANKSYGSFRAMADVDLQVRPGEFLTLLGPSGSGKTTTLNAIAGFTDLTSGDLRIGGQSVIGLPAHRRNIGVVFQHYALFPHMTVRQNVGYPLAMRKVPAAERDRRVAEALDMVKLSEFAGRYPAELSGGQQQRAAFARAIVFDPPLLLMDEPLGALDKKLREWLQLEIKRIHRELGTTFVFVTHDQEEALVLSDRIAVFNRGRIEQVGTGRALYDAPATLFVGEFIGESTVLRGKVEVQGAETAVSVAGRRVVARQRMEGPGTPVIFARPEKLALVPRGEGPNRLPGTVSEAIYLGSGCKYQVALQDGSVAIVRSGQDQPMQAIGDEVDVLFDASDIKLLADDTRTRET